MRNATDFLIDISDKMDKKLSITQKVLAEGIIPNYNFSDPFGMRTFLSVVKSPIVINSLDMGINTKDDFIKKTEKLPIPNGGSPIGYTVKESLKALQSADADLKRIIMITAGEETDGGVYEYEVEKANKEENIQVNIIGIGMRDQDSSSAKKTAEMSGGVFCNIPVEKGNDVNSIKEIIAPIIDILKGNFVSAPKVEIKKEEPKVEIKEEVKPNIVVEPKKEVVTPKVEVKEEVIAPKIEVKEEKVSFSKPVEAAPIFERKFEAPKKEFVKQEPAKEQKTIQPSYDALETVKETNTSIEDLLKRNAEAIQVVLKREKEAIAEIDRLKQIENNCNEKIDSLNHINEQAKDRIIQLQQEKKAADEEIFNLKIEIKELHKEIEKLIQREKDVIIELNAEERLNTSEKSEAYLFEYLQKKYPERVKWMNQAGKQTNGYDFKIVDQENDIVEYYIACKGALDSTRTFFLSEKEWDTCMNNSRNYQVYLIHNVDDKPKIILIDNLIAWIMSGKVRPGASRNEKVKAGQVMLSLAK